MAHFHPTENMLVEFSSGHLDHALSVCVAAHIEICPECSNLAKKLNAIGGSLLESVEPAEMSPNSIQAVLDRIKDTEQHNSSNLASNSTPCTVKETHNSSKMMLLPKVVRKVMPTNEPLKWKRISPSLKEARLALGQDKYEVSLHKIKRGGKVAEHDHRGREITLVLEGSFSDENGTYMAGDFIERKPGEKHRPIATQNEDCLCLSVVEAPIKLTGLFTRLLNPFLSHKPA